MLTGSLIMRPVAYDAFSTGISGRTFAMPIGRAPPNTSPSKVRAELPLTHEARTPRIQPAIPSASQRLAADTPQFEQVADVRVPAPIELEIGGQPHGVVVSVQQLVDQQRELFGQFH